MQAPIFLNARVRIDNILWCGDVELHVKSSYWYAHNHQLDWNYVTVILHVVYENDLEVKSRSGEALFCLELKDLIAEKYTTEYDTLYHSISNLPCSYAIGTLDMLFWECYSESLLIERLESKMARVQDIFYPPIKIIKSAFIAYLLTPLVWKLMLNQCRVLLKIRLCYYFKNIDPIELRLRHFFMVKAVCSKENM